MDKIRIYVWKQRKLNEICKINGRIGFRGYTQKDIVSQEQGGVLTFSPTNIVDNTLTMKCRNTYITKEKYEESPEIKIKNGDILFVKTGSTLGKSALVMGLHENATINPQIVVLRTQEEEAKFLSVILISDSLLKKVAAVKIGGAVPTITEAELKNFTFYEPEDFAERVKIGNCFTYFDSIITFHHRKLNILNKICRYAWEQRKVGDYYEFKNGLNKGKEFFGMGTPIVNFTDVFHKRGLLVSDLQGKVTLEQKEIDNFLVKKGDIFFTRTSETVEEIGYPSVMLESPENTVFSGFVLRGRTFLEQDPLEDVFKKYVFFTDSFRKEMMSKSSMTTRALTSGTAIKNMVFYHPLSKEEQKKIGDYFSKLDHLITLHQQKCKQLQL